MKKKLNLLRPAYSIVFGILALCSCVKISTYKIPLQTNVFYDTYYPNDTTAYFVNCTMVPDSVVTQMVKQIRSRSTNHLIDVGFGVYNVARDTVMSYFTKSVMLPGEFMACLNKKVTGPVFNITNEVFITRKMREDIQMRYYK